MAAILGEIIPRNDRPTMDEYETLINFVQELGFTNVDHVESIDVANRNYVYNMLCKAVSARKATELLLDALRNAKRDLYRTVKHYLDMQIAQRMENLKREIQARLTPPPYCYYGEGPNGEGFGCWIDCDTLQRDVDLGVIYYVDNYDDAAAFLYNNKGVVEYALVNTGEEIHLVSIEGRDLVYEW